MASTLQEKAKLHSHLLLTGAMLPKQSMVIKALLLPMVVKPILQRVQITLGGNLILALKQ